MATKALYELDKTKKRPTAAGEIKDDIKAPTLGGLTSAQFTEKYGMNKKTAKLINPKTASKMNRGGMTMRKGNMSYKKGGMTKRKK